MAMIGTLLIWSCFLFIKAQGEDVCWSTFGNYQYKVLAPSGGVLFADAEEYCQTINTTLASIHSAAEDEFLENFVMTQLAVPLWIGLKRHDEDMHWVDGTDVDYISPKYTRKSIREGCAYMFMGWNEENCQAARLHFICKREVTDAGACLTTTAKPPSTSTTESISVQTQNRESTTIQQSTSQNSIVTAIPIDYVTIQENDITSSQTEVTTESTSKRNNVETTNSATTISTVESTLNSVFSVLSSTTTVLSTTEQTPVSVTSSPIDISATTERKLTFQEMLDEMTVKEKPVYDTREGANSTAIGSVSMLILMSIILGIVLLDLSTIKKHLKMVKHNTKDFCRRKNETEVIYFK